MVSSIRRTKNSFPMLCNQEERGQFMHYSLVCLPSARSEPQRTAFPNLTALGMSTVCPSQKGYGTLIDCNRRFVRPTSSVTRMGSKSMVLNPCASAFRYFMTFVRKL